MVVVDLSVLNVLGRGANATGIAKRLFPWVWVGLAVNLISVDHVCCRCYRLSADPEFQAKMVVVLLLLRSVFIVQFKIPRWNESPVLPGLGQGIGHYLDLFWVGANSLWSEVPALSGIVSETRVTKTGVACSDRG